MELLDTLQKRYRLGTVTRQRKDLVFVTCEKEQAVPLLTELRDMHGFSHLSFLTAVDYPEDSRMQLTYLLHSFTRNLSLGLRVFLERETPVMHSAHHLWKQVRTYQRELREMYGIDFPGSPGLEDPFILEGWEGPPPMRRDFDTRAYSEETYFPRPGRSTRDPRSHMQEKLYPDSTPFEEGN